MLRQKIEDTWLSGRTKCPEDSHLDLSLINRKIPESDAKTRSITRA